MKPIVICGPTASGKTELALALAQAVNGLIISADSRQVYKQLTIGTAKPQGQYINNVYTVEGVPYYLVDFLNVTDTFNVGNFCEQVRHIIQQNPNKPLIFAGGTGMYLHTYFVGMDKLPPSTEQSRTYLMNLLDKHGKEGLHQLLQEKDPLSAEQIPIGNVQRTMRALEICYLTGQPASQLKSGNFFKQPNFQQAHWVYLDWNKELLSFRIETRTQNMFDGMCAETDILLKAGFSADNAPALKSLGYPQIISYLRGALSRAETLEQIIIKTRQYAKRQRTWFSRYTQAQKITLQKMSDWDVPNRTDEILRTL